MWKNWNKAFCNSIYEINVIIFDWIVNNGSIFYNSRIVDIQLEINRARKTCNIIDSNLPESSI